jgi:hypothetical protein
MIPIYREYPKGDLEQLKNLVSELGYSAKLIDTENNIHTIHKSGYAVYSTDYKM